jgi:serine/threonine protein kinase
VLENYQIGKVIGQGAYAVVRICYHRESQKKFAIKIYEKTKLNDNMKRKAV